MTTLRQRVNALRQCQTSHEVADLLRRFNIKGKRIEGTNCPMARFLTMDIKDQKFIYQAGPVGARPNTACLVVTREDQDGPPRIFPLGRGATRFMDKFDGRHKCFDDLDEALTPVQPKHDPNTVPNLTGICD